MSTSTMIHVAVHGSLHRADDLERALLRQLKDVRVAGEWTVKRRELGPRMTLDALSPPVAIPPALLSTLATRLGAAMLSIDTTGRVSVGTRSPEEERAALERAERSGERIVQVFYLHDRGSVPGEEPRRLPVSHVESLLDQMARESDFFGIVDEQGATLQAARRLDGSYDVEIPVPEARGSYGRVMSSDELRALLADLPRAFTVDAVDGLVFAPWR